MSGCSFTHVVIWKVVVTKSGGYLTDALDISSLAKVTDGYTPGHINTVVTQVLTERRIQQVWIQYSCFVSRVLCRIFQHLTTAVQEGSDCGYSLQLHRRPLTAAEFIAPLSKIDPIYKEEEEAYKVEAS